MKETEIGEFFKEKLSNSQQTPPADAWNGILQDPTLKRFNRARRVRRISLGVGIPTLVVAVSLAAFLLVPSKQHSPATSPAPTISKVETTTAATPAASTEILSASPASATPASSPTITQNETSIPAATITPLETQSPVATAETEPAPALPLMVFHPHPETENPANTQTPAAAKHTPQTDNGNLTKRTTGGDNPDTDEQTSYAMTYSKDTSVCRNSKVRLYVNNAESVFWSCGTMAPEVELYVSEPLTIRADIRTLDKRDTAILVNIGVYDCELFIPSAFTPNGDGLNDEWLVSAPANYTHYECVVKDKSGRILFQTKNIHQGWDGKSNGQYLPLGAYHYICRFRDEMGEQHIQQGQVMIIR